MTAEQFLNAAYKDSYKPELGDLALVCNYDKNTVTLMLFIGYADYRKQFNKLQSEFNDYTNLHEDLIKEAFEDFVFRPYYVCLGSCLANTRMSDNGKGVDLKNLFLKPERDIKYLLDCYNDFKKGFFKPWQLQYNNSVFIGSNPNTEYYFLIKSDIAIQDLKTLETKLLMSSMIPCHMYGKSEILEELQKGYKKRYIQLKAQSNSFVVDIHKNVTTTNFKKFGVYVRIDKNNKLYAYSYLGTTPKGENYFMPVFTLDNYREDVFVKKLFDVKANPSWIKKAYKKGRPKPLKLSLMNTNCVLLEPSLAFLTFDQQQEIKHIMAVLE